MSRALTGDGYGHDGGLDIDQNEVVVMSAVVAAAAVVVVVDRTRRKHHTRRQTGRKPVLRGLI